MLMPSGTPKIRRLRATRRPPRPGRPTRAGARAADICKAAVVTIEIDNESGVDVDVFALERLARHVLTEMGVHPLVELSIRLVDVPAMTAYHERYMNEPGPTDVLAFPM